MEYKLMKEIQNLIDEHVQDEDSQECTDRIEGVLNNYMRQRASRAVIILGEVQSTLKHMYDDEPSRSEAIGKLNVLMMLAG
jgi:hypothetical protein